MKVLMIEILGDGGIAHYTYNLSRELIYNKIDVMLYTSKNYELASMDVPYKVYNRMFRFATKIINKKPFIDKETQWPSFIRRIIKIIEYPLNTFEAILFVTSNNIRVIHLQSVNLIELFMVMMFRLFKRKVIYTVHNVKPLHTKILFHHKILFRILYRLCSEIIIHSDNGKKELITFFNLDENKIHIIPHGDYKFFVPEKQMQKTEAKKKLKFSADCNTILFFGSIRESKGLDKILCAMPLILNKVPNTKLLIVGEPYENYDKYSILISDNKLEDCIFEKLDYIPNDDVPKYFFASDIVVLPYNSITQSGVLQIAYAFGKPVVASDLPGFREVIKDGWNGFLVPKSDINQLSKKIVEIISDQKKIIEMGACSLKLSDEKYKWSSIARKTIDVYKT